MLRIVCLKWSDPAWERTYEQPRFFRYGAGHVNRLARMVWRNLSLPHEVVCITDDAEGIDEGIRVLPLPDVGRADRFFHKVALFSPEMADLVGPRFVFMDLDCVVTGDLTPLLERDDDFVIWRGQWNSRTPYNMSLFLMTAGARRQVWDAFDAAGWVDPPDRLKSVGAEQWFIGQQLGDEAVFAQVDGVYHFPNDFRRLPPSTARIVFFNGNHDPSRYRRFAWIKRNWR